MKNGVSNCLAVAGALSAVSAYAAGINGGGTAAVVGTDSPALTVVGPVETYDAQHHVARILGQTVLIEQTLDLVVGNNVAVIGTTSPSGVIVATSVKDQGLYVAGASAIFLSGHVQKINSSVGTATVGGVTVDLTPLMANHVVAPAVGTKIQVGGTQPALGGVVIANGINGGGMSAAGINGGGYA